MSDIQFHGLMILLVLATLLGLVGGIMVGFYFGYRRGQANTLRDFARTLHIPKGSRITGVTYRTAPITEKRK